MEYRCPIPQVFQETGSTYKTWQSMQLRFTTYLSTYSSNSQVNSLIYFLAGQEIEVLINALSPDFDQSMAINQFLFSLENSCFPKFLLLFRRFQFFSCKQDKGESMCQYISRLSELADFCEFGDLHDILIRDQIVSGLADEGIRQVLSQEEDLDRTKAEKICYRIVPCPLKKGGVCTIHKGAIPSESSNAKINENGHRQLANLPGKSLNVLPYLDSDSSTVQSSRTSISQSSSLQLNSETKPSDNSQSSVSYSRDADDTEDTTEVCFLKSPPKKKKKKWKEKRNLSVSAVLPSKPYIDMCSSLDSLLSSDLSSKKFTIYHQAQSMFFVNLGESANDNKLIEFYDTHKNSETENLQTIYLDLHNTEESDDKLIDMVDCDVLKPSLTSKEHDLLLDQLLEYGGDQVNMVSDLETMTDEMPAVLFDKKTSQIPEDLSSVSFNTEEKQTQHQKQSSQLEHTSDQKQDKDLPVGETYVCHVCGKKCNSEPAVKRHVKNVHRPRMYSCQVCGKAFAYPFGLQVHERKHTGERPFICEICGWTAASHGELNRHLREHAGIKKYECPVCHQKFFQKGAKDIHMRKHTGETPFVCQMCGKGFRARQDLKVHVRRHTGEKPHKCDICPKSFTTGTHLRRHKLIHSGVKPYACNICNSEFTRLANLKHHRETAHGYPF